MIAQDDPFTLRFLATLLRDRLGVPARPAVKLLPLDPTDPDWHLCDFPPIAPDKCRWLVNPTPDGGVVVHSPPRGFAAPEIRRLFLVLGAILAACVLAAVFVPPRLSDPDDRRFVTGLATIIGCFSACALFGTCLHALDQWTWHAGPQGTTFSRRMLCTTERRWPPGEILAIGTRALLANQPTTRVTLMVTANDRRAVTILTGSADEMRYLATLLRNATATAPASDRPG